MKITVIGAGHGGLMAAKVLAEAGHDVTIYEKSEKSELSYDWRDDIEPTVFDELKIPVPDSAYRTDCVSLVAPFSEKPLYVYSEEIKREWNIDRNVLAVALADSAEKEGAKICFGTAVDTLILENNKVKGVVVSGEKIYADLVIDACGMNSPFRSLAGIYDELGCEESFTVYRAYFRQAQGTVLPEKYRKKIYLKYLGNPGIAWCVCKPDGLIDVLIGKTGTMTDDEVQKSLTELRKGNPVIGNETVRGGLYAAIPIRYPLTKMVADGYAAVGNSAYMTIPLIGSGISNSLRAGNMLAEEIVRAGSADIEILWKYQVRYYREIGAGHYLVDCLKRMLLNADNEDIRYMFECGAITEDDMRHISCGEPLRITPLSLAQKAGKGLKKSGFIFSLAGAGLKGLRAQHTAENIPEDYNETEIIRWQRKINKLYGK